MNAPKRLRCVFSAGLMIATTWFGCLGQKGVTVGQMTFFPYQTKTRRLESGAMFFWFFSQDRKTIIYEPCTGTYGIHLLKESKNEIDFEITESRGIPLALLSGRKVAKSDVIGKQYKAAINGDQISAVSEIR